MRLKDQHPLPIQSQGDQNEIRSVWNRFTTQERIGIAAGIGVGVASLATGAIMETQFPGTGNNTISLVSSLSELGSRIAHAAPFITTSCSLVGTGAYIGARYADIKNQLRDRNPLEPPEKD